MEGRGVLTLTLAALLVGLIAVPSINLIADGCNAGTKGLFVWLPRLWDEPSSGSRPCEAGQVLRDGYQILCPEPSRDALEELLDNIGFFGSRESQELALCQFGKTAWRSLSDWSRGIVDAAFNLHQTVTKSLSENSISAERVVEIATESAYSGLHQMTEFVSDLKERLIDPVINLPHEISRQYSQLWQFYHSIRDSQLQWISELVDTLPSFSGILEEAKVRYLDPIWSLFAVDRGVDDVHSVIEQAMKELSSSQLENLVGFKGSIAEFKELVRREKLKSSTKGYVSQILNYVTNSETSKAKSTGAQDQEAANKAQQPVLANDENIPSASMPFSELSLHLVEDGSKEEGMYEVEVAGCATLKKVLFEALVATVLAFTLFILGVVIHRLRRAQLFGLRMPSLKQMVTSKYTPVKLIGSSKNFYAFHMMSKKSRQDVYVKFLQSSPKATAIAKFNNELRCLKRLSHSSVVGLLECPRVRTRFCLVLEYAEYGDLRKAMKNPVKPIGFYEKIRIYRQVLEAVHWMHKLGWSHLNIRPASILVFDLWYSVKLSGFSQAVELPYGELCNSYNLHPMCSTPRVMARQPYNPVKADLWALGTLLYYIFTKRDIPNCQEAIRLAGVVSKMDFVHSSINGLNLLRLLSDLLSFEPNNRPELQELLEATSYL